MGFRGSNCAAAIQQTKWSKWVIFNRFGDLADVRFTHNSDRLLRRHEMMLCANTRREQVQ